MFIAVPLRDQLNEPAGDGGPDDAPTSNCVPACLSSAATELTGHPFYGDELRDAVYGEQGGATDPEAYAGYLARQGVSITMYAAPGNQQQLLDSITSHLLAGILVTAAIPSQWGAPPQPDPTHQQGGTHQVLFCGYDAGAGTLTAMNPWPEPPSNNAWYQTMPLWWWMPRIVYGHTFILTGGAPVPAPYVVNSDGTLTYPAHDGLPTITLIGANANWIRQNAVTVRPVASETYWTANDSYTPFEDGSCTIWYKPAGQFAYIPPNYGGRLVVSLLAKLRAASTQQIGTGNVVDSTAIVALAAALKAHGG